MTETTDIPAHARMSRPSPWVLRFAHLVPPGATLLDVAAGGGRHSRFFLDRGVRVTAIDKDIRFLAPREGLEIIAADLETGAPWPLPGRKFDAVLVTNYLFRPLFPDLSNALAPGGLLLYETFARGNEAYAPPRNPDHLLRPGELLDFVAGKLQIIAFEQGYSEDPRPSVIQRIAARDDSAPAPLGSA